MYSSTVQGFPLLDPTGGGDQSVAASRDSAGGGVGSLFGLPSSTIIAAVVVIALLIGSLILLIGVCYVRRSVSPTLCSSVPMSIIRSSVHLSVPLSVRLFLPLSICPPLCPPVSLSVPRFVCLYNIHGAFYLIIWLLTQTSSSQIYLEKILS